MKVEGTVKSVKDQVKEWKKEGLSIGFVPTMGYLHEGHASLIKAAREGNDRVVVSIFVNPMQFGPTEDLASYPRDLAKDSALCESLGVDMIFHPEPEEMYHENFSSYVDTPDFEVRNATVLSVMRLQSPVNRLADSTFSTGRRDIWRM